MQSLAKKFLKNILPSSLVLSYKTYKGKIKKRKKMPILSFGIDLVDHCILNCKHCDHFAPIASKYFLDISTLEKDFQKLSELTNKKIGECKFLGGEPLLHPEITNAIAIFRKHFPPPPVQSNPLYNQGFILTNGLLLPKMPKEFWECCSANQMTLKITKYPIDLDYNAIEQKCVDENVKILYSGKTGTVLKTLYYIPLDLSGKQNHKNSFFMCSHSNSSCTAFRDGKIYPCHLLSNIHHFNNYFGANLEIEKNDYIDIHKISDIDNVLSFLKEPKPFCRYCKTGERRTEIPWGRSKKDLSELV